MSRIRLRRPRIDSLTAPATPDTPESAGVLVTVNVHTGRGSMLLTGHRISTPLLDIEAMDLLRQGMFVPDLSSIEARMLGHGTAPFPDTLPEVVYSLAGPLDAEENTPIEADEEEIPLRLLTLRDILAEEVRKYYRENHHTLDLSPTTEVRGEDIYRFLMGHLWRMSRTPTPLQGDTYVQVEEWCSMAAQEGTLTRSNYRYWSDFMGAYGSVVRREQISAAVSDSLAHILSYGSLCA